MSNLQVAQTILSQLGGNRFMIMTGAKNLVGGENSLQFSIGKGAKKGINKVRIVLKSNDTYTMEFYKMRGVDFNMVAKHEGIYCDQLREIFTSETGFYTSL